MKIKIEYEVEFDDRQKSKLLKRAEENGYGYKDAGPIELLTRMFIYEGVEAVWEEMDPVRVYREVVIN